MRAAAQMRFPFGIDHGGPGWGERKKFVEELPAGQTIVVPAALAKSLYVTARRIGRRASVYRPERGSTDRVFTVWGALS